MTAATATKKPSAGGSFVGNWGLLVLTVAIFAMFAIILPQTFPTFDNLRAILTNQSIPALLALAATIPIVTGRFDLSIGYGVGLAHVVAMYLLVNTGLHWTIVCLIVVAFGVVVGLVNGFLVEFAHIDSFIATLGTGSVLYALTGWITGGARIVPTNAGLPDWFTDLTNSTFIKLPVTFWYVVVLVVVLWLLFEHLPLGRYLYVVGANPRAADLVGIKRSRVVILAFVGSGAITAVSGVLLAAQQQIGDPSAGQNYLLPAFVGALLGSTTIKPGRANAFGTIVAVAVLAIGLSGLQQLGAAFWVTPLFNGLTLLAAVGLAGVSARRRQAGAAVIGAAGRGNPPAEPADEPGKDAEAQPAAAPAADPPPSDPSTDK